MVLKKMWVLNQNEIEGKAFQDEECEVVGGVCVRVCACVCSLEGETGVERF